MYKVPGGPGASGLAPPHGIVCTYTCPARVWGPHTCPCSLRSPPLTPAVDKNNGSGAGEKLKHTYYC